MNWPMQSHGAEILRLAISMCVNHGIKVIAPVHDAILIEASSDSIETKTVQLVVWNSQSCISEFRRDILVRPEISAGFTNDISDGCHPVTVEFIKTMNDLSGL